MQRPGRKRETPSTIAGLGLIRVSVGHSDGTSHLILQGIARVQLAETIRYKPYRIQRIHPVNSPPCSANAVSALVTKVRALMHDWVRLGMPFPFPAAAKTDFKAPPPGIPPKDVLDYLDALEDPDQIADLVSCAVLSGPLERQAILETVHLETRFKHLVHYLMAEIVRHGKHGK